MIKKGGKTLVSLLVILFSACFISCSYVPPRPRPQLNGISFSYQAVTLDSGKMERSLLHYSFTRLECHVFQASVECEYPDNPDKNRSMTKKIDPWLNLTGESAAAPLTLSGFAPLWLAPARLKTGETSPLQNDGSVVVNTLKAKKLSWHLDSTTISLLYDLKSGFLLRAEYLGADKSIRLELLKTNQAQLADWPANKS